MAWGGRRLQASVAAPGSCDEFLRERPQAAILVVDAGAARHDATGNAAGSEQSQKAWVLRSRDRVEKERSPGRVRIPRPVSTAAVCDARTTTPSSAVQTH